MNISLNMLNESDTNTVLDIILKKEHHDTGPEPP